ncbi:MAG: hypothetical protein AAF597_14630, partial [Bacteroidota bacterium]
MENLFTELPPNRFFYYLLLLGGIYLLLWVLPVVVRLVVRPGRSREWWLQFLRDVRVIYQPVALVLALILLVFVNPLPHALLVAGFVVLGWNPLRNFVGGRLLQATNHLSEGQEIMIGQVNGTIQALEPLNLLLQTEDGTHVIPYRELQKAGFTIRRGARISGMREFLLVPNTESAAKPAFLRDHLFICPYLDWGT